MSADSVLPIAIVLPHSGLDVPPQVADRIALSERRRFLEADAYADRLYDFHDRVLHWVCFPYARAIIDVNRPEDAALNRPGDGIVKRLTSYGGQVYRPNMEPGPALERELIDRYWRPWHERLAAIAEDARVKLVIDAHSMAAIGPSHYDDPSRLRPRVSVSNLGDRKGRKRENSPRLSAPPKLAQMLAQELETALTDVSPLAAVGAGVAINRPFAGGWDLKQHGGVHQPWLMIEVNRAMYLGRQDAESAIVPANMERIALLRERLWIGLSRLCERMGVLPARSV